METTILYIGPGLGVATIVIVFLVLLIILASMGMVVWTPIKSFFQKTKKFIKNRE